MADLNTRLCDALSKGHAADVGELMSDARFTDADNPAEAAVLIAVTEREEPTVLLTQRPNSMRSHPGQVAFPGGKLDTGEDAIAAALREAEEELALPQEKVRVIGTTDRYQTGTGFDITPVLATVPADLPLVPNPGEVEDWFEAPLDMLLSRDGWDSHEVFWNGKMRHYLEMHYQGFRIWGVTAAIIANLATRIGPHWEG
jgi:8-oxo-dGTP pyrophosphatase MutT (NUDIX family)